MEFIARLKEVNKSMDGEYQITFTTKSNTSVHAIIEKLSEVDIKIKAVKFHKKRSLDANAYMWVLIQKMADVLMTSTDELYEELLQRYGVRDPEVVVTCLSKVDMTKIDGHWQLYSTSTDGKFKAYMKIIGTSQYDSKQMATFIDHIVIEAKGLDIETLPPQELERMFANEYSKTNGAG